MILAYINKNLVYIKKNVVYIVLGILLMTLVFYKFFNQEDFVPYNDLNNIKDDKIVTLNDDILKFDKHLNINVQEIPNTSDFYKHPYYEKFPYNISSKLLVYIHCRLINTEYEKDKILITKEPYNVYYSDVDPYGLQKCVLNIEIVNNTQFFVRTLQFYVLLNKDGTSMQIISLKVDDERKDFKYIPSNKDDNIQIF